jgi:predicted nucleic acid-binding Zn ribbon protein
MPTYLYETVPDSSTDVVERFEVKQSFAETPLAAHPTTGLPVRRVISGGAGFVAPGASDALTMGGCGPQNCGCGKFS